MSRSRDIDVEHIGCDPQMDVEGKHIDQEQYSDICLSCELDDIWRTDKTASIRKKYINELIKQADILAKSLSVTGAAMMLLFNVAKSSRYIWGLCYYDPLLPEEKETILTLFRKTLEKLNDDVQSDHTERVKTDSVCEGTRSGSEGEEIVDSLSHLLIDIVNAMWDEMCELRDDGIVITALTVLEAAARYCKLEVVGNEGPLASEDIDYLVERLSGILDTWEKLSMQTLGNPAPIGLQ